MTAATWMADASIINSGRKGIALVAASLLSACATKAPSTPPVEPQFTTAEAQGSVQKYVVLDSHTFVYDANKKRVEQHGVPCTVNGDGFASAFTTPVNLRLPVFGVKTSDLSMTCRYDGQEKFKQLRYAI